MRGLIQRVLSARVLVGGKVVGQIGRGLLCLVGIHRNDKPQDYEFIRRKILNLRFWPDESGKPWARSVMEKKYEVLLVSQFTLHATLKGNKLDFHEAMDGEKGKAVWQEFVEATRKEYNADAIKEGVFGAMMEVELTNEGPVTIMLDTEDKQFKPVKAPKGKGEHKQSQAKADDSDSGSSEPKAAEAKASDKAKLPKEHKPKPPKEHKPKEPKQSQPKGKQKGGQPASASVDSVGSAAAASSASPATGTSADSTAAPAQQASKS